MAKQRNTPTASPPPTKGEGCLARYDPEALDDTDGTDFPGAAELWQKLNPPDAISAPGKVLYLSDAEAAHQVLEATGLLFQI